MGPEIRSFSVMHFIASMITRVLVLFQATEIFNFTQDDLMTEDIFILDCYSAIFVWVGKKVDSMDRSQALTIGKVHNTTRSFPCCLEYCA